MEKIILAYNTLNQDGLGSKLLREMMEKNVPGFCVEVKEALKIMELNENSYRIVRRYARS